MGGPSGTSPVPTKRLNSDPGAACSSGILVLIPQTRRLGGISRLRSPAVSKRGSTRVVLGRDALRLEHQERWCAVTSYVPHPGVDAYLVGLPEWEREICQQVRELAHAADPEVEETVKPYFVLQGNVCALLATKDHVNLFLYDGGSRPTRTASSLVATGTAPAGRSRTTRATSSPTARCSTSSGRSSPTTAPAAGGRSRLTPNWVANCWDAVVRPRAWQVEQVRELPSPARRTARVRWLG
jgi:hypothetical protein